MIQWLIIHNSQFTTKMKPVVAIVGRPNAGKSSLFNRLTRSQAALVDDTAGVTRDRHYGTVTWQDREFLLVDTGGLSEDPSQEFGLEIQQQIQQARQEADVIILLLDGKAGASPFDAELLNHFRAALQPVLFAVNKIDGPHQEVLLADFYQLGIGPLYPISSLHRYGVHDLMDALLEQLPVMAELPAVEEKAPIKVAVVGRPNVGKSSLVNRLLGEERMIVSDIPGTTRDVIDTLCDMDGRSWLLMDTAGIRRKNRVSERLEKFSVLKTLRSLERCDIALILLDASQGVTEQDVRVAAYAQDRGCGCLLLLNKWDLLPKGAEGAKKLYDSLREATRFMPFAPLLSISARTGLRTGKILPQAAEVFEQYITRLTTHRWNTLLEQAVKRNEPPLHKGKRLKFYFITQTGTHPPTLVAFVNYPEAVHFSYQRYLINQFRQGSGLDKVPLKLIFRQRTGFIDFSGRKAKGGRQKGKGERRKVEG